MLPRELKLELFREYPPEARKLIAKYLGALQQLPLSFLPSVLREAIDFDYRFPAERRALERELANLNSLSAEQMQDWLRGFAQIHLSAELDSFDWINAPAQFVEQLSSYLWTTHQLDAFRTAAVSYADRLRDAVTPEPPAMPRLGIAVIGQAVSAYDAPLFRKLRAHGAFYTGVDPQDGLRVLLDIVAERAKAHPAPYAHWYVDGGRQAACDPALTSVSYAALEPARTALLAKMRADIDRPGMGPEALRTHLAQLRPVDLGYSQGDEVLDRFRVKMLTEGSGTQVFSTTFAQWTAREALRRAQPLTLLVRFAPRQRQRPMNELLRATLETAELDPVGSLVDADMGAYYNWLNQQRLPGANQAGFVAWFEGQSQAVAIGPATPRGTTSSSTVTLRELVSSLI
jgi:hypothetical protein